MCKDNRKYASEHDVIENRTCIPAQITEGQSEFQYLIYMFWNIYLDSLISKEPECIAQLFQEHFQIYVWYIRKEQTIIAIAEKCKF